MISQIPGVIYAVSTARTRRWETPFGTVSLHHIAPALFFGFETAKGGRVRMAGPEKALLDILYLSPARSRLFAKLPELDLERVDLNRVAMLLDQIEPLRLRQRLRSRFDSLPGRIR